MINALKSKEATLAVIGLGYVGLPIALEFAKKIKVVGFDINEKRVQLLKSKIDPSKELDSMAFEGSDILFTNKLEDLGKANFFIVAVPTPVDEHNIPDLRLLLKASETVGKVIKQNDVVVFESTVYPGCTQEDCIPIIEKHSGLKASVDFSYGYSPERINPGDKEHTITKIVKVVSGDSVNSLNLIAEVYQLIVAAGVYKAASVKVAEAAKVIENTQRDLNIALMNELSIIFDKMKINTYEVLEAAGTKWNFLKFQPGLVGGHCIGVDPYYLTHKASELGYKAQVILAGRSINDNMPKYIAQKVLQHIIENVSDVKHSKVLVKGVTFKENVSDIRNSKTVDMIKELKSYFLQVDVEDPYAEEDALFEEYGFTLNKQDSGLYDAVIIAVPHAEYYSLTETEVELITHPHALVVDVKGILKQKITNRKYWSL